MNRGTEWAVTAQHSHRAAAMHLAQSSAEFQNVKYSKNIPNLPLSPIKSTKFFSILPLFYTDIISVNFVTFCNSAIIVLCYSVLR